MSVLEKMSSAEAIALEEKYGAHNYHPLPVVLSRGEGVYVWDVEGKKYFDFLSAYSAVNQGHCHPKIVDAMVQQAQTLTLTSRAFYNDKLGVYEEFVTSYFGFDKVLPMNTGAEAVETALKLCRKWAYEKKGINENDAQIIVCDGNFHGRTTTIISFSNDENARKNFGPYTAGFISIPYDNIDALEKVVTSSKNIAGFLVEPIQGEAGVYTPSEDFIKKAKNLSELIHFSKMRLRPILLTSITTILGLSTLIFFSSGQALILQPMAVSLGFGLAWATVLNLYFVPMVYRVIYLRKCVD